MREVLMWVAVVLSAATASAQATDAGDGAGQTPSTGNDRVRAALEAGVVVSVIDDSGRRVQGPVREFSGDTLRVFARGRLEDIQMDHIVRIERPDGVGDGALKGLAIGSTIGLVGAALNVGEVHNKAAFVVASVFGNGLIYAALGTGLDALFDNSETLYERNRTVSVRVAPVVARGIRGATVSVSW